MQKLHKADFAVVGGGLAGMLAAIAAARHGAKVILMQDRPVLGGNCSSEIRMWALGCHGENNRETGIFEEILLENMYRNPDRNFSVWDSILYEKVTNEPNITLILNCSCIGAEMDGNSIKSVMGWQLTSYTWHRVQASLFADCSGDSILADMTGAEYRMGRESSEEYGEDIAPAAADTKTMGMSCLIQARQTDRPSRFIPPEWAYVYESDDQLPHRNHDLSAPTTNFWWMELGGERHSIYDTEELRDELLKVAFGVWDHIKNRGDHGADNWELEWVGYLPGKRESRRYIGDHVLTQNDVRSEGRFDDLVAYGGWSMDDHHPAGLNTTEKPTIFHPAPAPYGIPYRCLFSKNIENLFFAGRNISATHSAMSSSRVMATCAILGQAVGTAAAIAVNSDLNPRGIYEHKIRELQQTLMEDDCYLPWNQTGMSGLCLDAKLSGCEDAENLRNGTNRPVKGKENGCLIPLGQAVEYRFGEIRSVSRVQVVFDSDLERTTCIGHKVLRRYPMLCNRFYDMEPFGFPATVTKSFQIESMDESGKWVTVADVRENHQRLFRLDQSIQSMGIRLIPLETWGSEKAHVYEFAVK